MALTELASTRIDPSSPDLEVAAALQVGLVAAAARERTGALAAGIAMHAIYNGLMLAAQM